MPIITVDFHVKQELFDKVEAEIGDKHQELRGYPPEDIDIAAILVKQWIVNVPSYTVSVKPDRPVEATTYGDIARSLPDGLAKSLWRDSQAAFDKQSTHNK